MSGEHAVGRVIARPFTGRPGAFGRTDGRRDFALAPPARSYLQELQRRWRRGARRRQDRRPVRRRRGRQLAPGRDQRAGARRASMSCSASSRAGLVFVNLIETDQVYGHRKDVARASPARCARSTRCLAGAARRLRADGPADRDRRPRRRSRATRAPTTRASTRRCWPSAARCWQRARGARRAWAAPRHDGPLADVGATVLRWLTGREAPTGSRARVHKLGAMPELPEVETISRQLAPLVEGRRAGADRDPRPALVAPAGAARSSRTRSGGASSAWAARQVLVWSFDGDVHLAQHLRMTGAVLCRSRPGAARTCACAWQLGAPWRPARRRAATPGDRRPAPLRHGRAAARLRGARGVLRRAPGPGAVRRALHRRAPARAGARAHARRSRRCCSTSARSRAWATSTPTRRCSARASTRCGRPGGCRASSTRACARA